MREILQIIDAIVILHNMLIKCGEAERVECIDFDDFFRLWQCHECSVQGQWQIKPTNSGMDACYNKPIHSSCLVMFCLQCQRLPLSCHPPTKNLPSFDVSLIFLNWQSLDHQDHVTPLLYSGFLNYQGLLLFFLLLLLCLIILIQSVLIEGDIVIWIQKLFQKMIQLTCVPISFLNHFFQYWVPILSPWFP